MVIRQFESFAQGVNNPTQDQLLGFPGAIAGPQLFHQGWLLTVGFFVRGRLEDFIDAVKK